MEEAYAKKVDTKETKKEEAKEVEVKKPKFVRLFDEDQLEVKLLTSEDVEDCVKIMKKCSFDVTAEELVKIINYGMSVGCYVDRMLIGVGLGWPASYDSERKMLMGDAPNALYLEDPAVLLMYEGRGIRQILVRERQNAAAERKFRYALAYLSEDMPHSSIEDYIKETGSQLEKVYLAEGYEFIPTQKGVLALKRLG